MPRDTNSGRSRRALAPLEPSAAAPAGSRIDQIEWRDPAALVPYCPKPVALYQHLLEALTKRGQAIFEPFSGSGTTLIACERSSRKCRAVEISPAYVDVAILRWQQVTGQDAIRQAGGETFNAMRAGRG